MGRKTSTQQTMLYLFTFTLALLGSLMFTITEARYGAPNKIILPILQPYQCYSHYPGNSELAMYDLNTNPNILQDYEIGYAPFSNCGNDASATVQQLIQIMQVRKTNASMQIPIIIGPNSYIDSASAFTQDPNNDLMFLGPLSADSKYSDRTLYPNYARLDLITVDEAQPLLMLCQRNGWTKVNIVYDVQYRDFVDTFTTLAYANGLNIETTQSFIGTPATGSTYSIDIDLTHQLEQVATTGCYITILLAQGSDSTQILPQMVSAGMFGEGSRYVTLGVWEWFKTRPQWTTPIRNLTTGTIGLIMTDPTSPEFNAFNQRWNALYNMNWRLTYNPWLKKNSSTPPNTSAYQVYDTIMVAGMALDKYLPRYHQCVDNPSDPVIQATPDCVLIANKTSWKILYSIILNTSYDGASGFVKFKPNGDREPIFTLVNGQGDPANTLWTKVGIYTTGNLTFNTNPILYTTGYAVPRDSDRGILPGDKLQVDIGAPLGVLSYVIAVLGSWVTLLLIEAAVYEKRFKSLKWFRIYVLLSAVTFGVGAEWATVFISMAELGFQESIIDLSYQPVPTMLSLLVSFATSFIAFYGMSVYYHKQKINKVLKYTETSTASVTSESNSNSESDKSGYELKDTLLELTMGFHFGVFIYGLVLVAGLVLLHIIERAARETQARIEFDGGILAAALIVGTVLMMIGNILFFYLVRWRFVGAFVMALGIVLGNQLSLRSENYYYDPSITIDSGLWEPYIITIITCVTAAVICFAFLGLQFSRMQLSRLALDQLLKKIKKEMMALQGQLDMKGDVIRSKQEEIEYQKHLMDLIHYIRPLHSKTSLIAGMAKHTRYLNFVQEQTAATSPLGAANALGKASPLFSSADLNSSYDRVKQIKVASSETETSVHSSNTQKGKNTNIEQSQTSVRPFSANELAVLQLSSAPGNKRLLRTVADLFPSIEGPIPEYLVRTINLNTILSNPVCLEIFKDTMCAEKVEENVAFFLEIQRYQITEEARDRATLAELIVADYIDADAPFQINISSHLRSQIEALVAKGNSDKDLFNGALAEVLKLIESNNWPRFISTKQFYTCALVLGLTKDFKSLM